MYTLEMGSRFFSEHETNDLKSEFTDSEKYRKSEPEPYIISKQSKMLKTFKNCFKINLLIYKYFLGYTLRKLKEKWELRHLRVFYKSD